MMTPTTQDYASHSPVLPELLKLVDMTLISLIGVTHFSNTTILLLAMLCDEFLGKDKGGTIINNKFLEPTKTRLEQITLLWRENSYFCFSSSSLLLHRTLFLESCFVA